MDDLVAQVKPFMRDRQVWTMQLEDDPSMGPPPFDSFPISKGKATTGKKYVSQKKKGFFKGWTIIGHSFFGGFVSFDHCWPLISDAFISCTISSHSLLTGLVKIVRDSDDNAGAGSNPSSSPELDWLQPQDYCVRLYVLKGINLPKPRGGSSIFSKQACDWLRPCLVTSSAHNAESDETVRNDWPTMPATDETVK